MRISLVLILIIIRLQYGYSQKILKDQEFFRAVLKDTGQILDINLGYWETDGIFEIPDIPFGKPQSQQWHLLKNNNGLFVCISGTGRVYKIEDIKGSLNLLRIDSTIFFGNNFGASFFSFQDTLFSFGGYGYWHFNGDLRYYIDEKAEWEKLFLNKETQVQNSPQGKNDNAWFDAYSQTLFIRNSKNNPDSVFALDMKTKRWKTLGYDLSKTNFVYVASLPWGLLVRRNLNADVDEVYFLIDYKHNVIKLLASQKRSAIIANGHPYLRMYVRDSTLYFSKKFESGSFNVVDLAESDFVSLEEKIYEPVESKSFIYSRNLINISKWLIGILISFSVGAFITYRYFILKERNSRVQITNGYTLVYDTKQKELLKFILSKSINHKPTSIDEINRLLGISEKSVDLQKKHRSDVITSVNEKFRLSTGSEVNLIVSKRSEFDKRSFEYFIDSSNFSFVEKV